MNKWIGMGRLTKNPDVRHTDTTVVARYTLAVDRRRKEDGADFVQCVVFGKGAEFAEKYLHKGMKIAVDGHIQTGSYDGKDGKKVYTTEAVIENQEFAERKQQESSGFAPVQDDFKAPWE